MTFICKACGGVTDAPVEQTVDVGDEVNFSELTISNAGTARVRAKEGTVKEVNGDYLTIKQKWSKKIYQRHKTSVTKKGNPNPLTLALLNPCECNTTKSQKEAQQ